MAQGCMLGSDRESQASTLEEPTEEAQAPALYLFLSCHGELLHTIAVALQDVAPPGGDPVLRTGEHRRLRHRFSRINAPRKLRQKVAVPPRLCQNV